VSRLTRNPEPGQRSTARTSRATTRGCEERDGRKPPRLRCTDRWRSFARSGGHGWG